MANWFPRLTGSPPHDTWATRNPNSGTIDGTGEFPPVNVVELGGSASLSFTVEGELSYSNLLELAGSSSLTFTANGNLSVTGAIVLEGSSSLTFSSTGNLSVTERAVIELAGSTSLTFTPTGRLTVVNTAGSGASSFEIKRQGRVWLEYQNNYYLLHTKKDVAFSQTFRQTSTTKRTLHSLNSLFDGSVINEANPADFSFELFLINDDSLPVHQHLPLELLLAYNGNTLNTFNLYFVYSENSREVYYKIENCVFTGGTFNISRVGILSVSFTGQGSKLTRTAEAFVGYDYEYVPNPDIAVSKEILVTVNADVLTNILGVSLEVSNEIEWIANNTLQKSLAATNTSTSTFPEKFTLNGRKVAGSIQQYISGVSTSNINLQTWQEDTTVRIQTGNSTSDICLDVNMVDACSFTNRLDMGDVFTQNYDFRLMTSPSDLKNYFNY